MAAVTIQKIVQDALSVLGEVLGVGVQTYTEPRLIADAGRAFNMLFKKRWWEQYTKWTTVTLDGTTGVITTNAFTQVYDFEDFAKVCRGGMRQGLPTLPPSVNPSTITGTIPRCYTSLDAGDANYAARKIKIYPIAATGTLDVRARFHPLTAGDDWANATSVHFDRDLLVFGTAFMALSGDDLNPQAKVDAQNMMDVRYKDLERSLSSQDTAMGSDRGDVPRDWFIV